MTQTCQTEKYPAITIVMAVYNSETCVGRAIESILHQTYENWTLICVNDGSTDNSLSILRKYQQVDTRINVITKTNGGPASARAEAYKIVDTPYFISLDADDCFSNDLLMNVAKTAFETQADAIAPNFLSQHANGSYSDWNRDNDLIPGQSMTGLDAFKRLFIAPSMHGCNLWRSDLTKRFAVDDNALYNNLNSDEYIQRLLFLNSNNIVISNGTYIYNYNGDSITKKFSIKHLGYIQTCKKYIALIDEYNIDEATASIIKEYYLRHIIHLQIRYYRDANDMSKNDRKLIKQSLKTAYKDALKYKKSIFFKDKYRPWLYRFAATSGYTIFNLTCKAMAIR